MGIFGGGGSSAPDPGPSIASIEKGRKEGYAAVDKYYPIAQNYLQGAINSAQANLGPYNLIGNNAIDMYTDTLGVARPAASSYELQQALLNSPKLTSTSTTPQGTTAQQALATQYRSGTLPMQVTPTENVLSRFQQSPGYQFAMQQGLQALDRSAASKGQTGSGAALKGVTDYAQGLANQEFGNYQDRLAQMAGMGASAAQLSSNIALQGGAAQAETASNAGASMGNISTSSASNIANVNMAAQQAAANQQSSNNSLFGSILGAGASILGGPIGGGASKYLFG